MSDPGVDAAVDEIVAEFLVESHENLDQLDRDLVQLERDPEDRPCLGSIFRTIHTIKGTSGFLGFGQLETLTHVGENLLSRLRDGKLALDAEMTSALLSMVDAIRGMLSAIEATGSEGVRDDRALVDLLTRLHDGGSAGSARMGELLAGSTNAQPADIEKALCAQEAADPGRVGEILVVQSVVEPREVAEAPVAQVQVEPGGGGLSDASVRVDVALLDKLMVLAGELVLARNQILQLGASGDDNSFLATSQRLNVITTELQEGIMKTRMQPIGNVWAKFPRVVRDLAVACHKQVRLESDGHDTELDRTIIEAIKDPLTHLLRNAVDHGIESAAQRLEKGKPPEGCVRLRAFHEGGHVNIEIGDDGAGLDLGQIQEKALAKGLIRPEGLSSMSERDITNLIFLPGFSTSEVVSNVSGRGVGMDVVKTNIEKIGGTIDVVSKIGTGTTFRLKIPLTLAIIPALIVTSGGQRYAIPQVSLLELVRLDPEMLRSSIEYVGDAPVHRLRGRLLPLVDLSEQLGVGMRIPPRVHADCGGGLGASMLTLVVLQADGQEFGLVVESVSDTEEIVVKPLARQLKATGVYSGAAIMGDGRVALILDVRAVAQRAHVLAGSSGLDSGPGGGEARGLGDRQSVLIIGVGPDSRAAVPLRLVDRLEEIPSSSVEMAGYGEVVQYRGKIMAIVRLGKVLGGGGMAPLADEDMLSVIVHRSGKRVIGLVVDRVVDIVDDYFELDQASAKAGLLGSAIIDGRVTDIVDLTSIVESVSPRAITELIGSHS